MTEADLGDDLVAAAHRLPARLEGDAAFREAAGWWTGSFGLMVGSTQVVLVIVDGTVESASEGGEDPSISFGGSVEAWRAHLAGLPRREGGLERPGARGQFWQYFAAIGRLLEVYSETV